MKPTTNSYETSWEKVIQIMGTADEKAIRSLLTENGFKKISELKQKRSFTKLSLQEYFFRLNEIWSKQEIRWIEVDNNKAIASLGPSPKSTRIEFVKRGKIWLLDYWGGPGK